MSFDIIAESINKSAAELKKLALRLHAEPEIGLQEFKAAAAQIKLLKKWGFKVTSPFCGLKTAYKAVYGTGKPVFATMSEYDALPGIGHACGHNLICISALGAGRALSELIKKKKINGSVVIFGTPGEESNGGKVQIVNKDGLKGIDAVIMAHADKKTRTWKGCFGVKRFDVIYTGKASHAAGAPEKGINALDAVMLLFQGINAWREHLPEKTRVHGIVTDGGKAPNIVPDRAAASFYLRAATENELNSMIKRFSLIAEGAAIMTECRYKIESGEAAYKSGNPNDQLNQAYYDAANRLGMKPLITREISRASTDFGDVSQVVPGAHVYFGIFSKGKGAALHTKEFATAAKSNFAVNKALKAASAMAEVGLHFYTDKNFRQNIKNEFLKK